MTDIPDMDLRVEILGSHARLEFRMERPPNLSLVITPEDFERQDDNGEYYFADLRFRDRKIESWIYVIPLNRRLRMSLFENIGSRDLGKIRMYDEKDFIILGDGSINYFSPTPFQSQFLEYLQSKRIETAEDASATSLI